MAQFIVEHGLNSLHIIPQQDQSAHVIQDRSVTDPTAFQLAINYRSHGGIVNCAHTVIERITRFWPDAIDVLQPERGIVQGFKPLLSCGWDQDTVRYEQFLFGASYVNVIFFLPIFEASLTGGALLNLGHSNVSVTHCESPSVIT